MDAVEKKSLRDELFKEHPSTSGPFPVAHAHLRVFGILAPYLILSFLPYFGYSMVALALVPIVSLIRPVVSTYLGSSIFESFVQIKVVDAKTMSKPKLAKFILREVWILGSVLLSLLLGAGFVFFASVFSKVTHSPEGLSTLYLLCAATFLALPFVYILFDKNNQTLFDKLSGVVVISTAPHFKVDYPVTLVTNDVV